MKFLASALFVSFLSLNSWAAIKNPMIRTCQQEGGVFWTVKTLEDELALCVFGQAAIGALDLLDLKTMSRASEALMVYMESDGAGLNSCEGFRAEKVVATDSQQEAFTLCRFSDNSVIEEGTLMRGRGDAANKDLDRVLLNH